MDDKEQDEKEVCSEPAEPLADDGGEGGITVGGPPAPPPPNDGN